MGITYIHPIQPGQVIALFILMRVKRRRDDKPAWVDAAENVEIDAIFTSKAQAEAAKQSARSAALWSEWCIREVSTTAHAPP